MNPHARILMAIALLVWSAGQAEAQFSDATSGPLGDAAGGIGAAWGDYDGDDDLDLYVGSDGENKLFRNDGGSWVDATSGPLGDTGAATAVAWGDYDNDGDLDIYFTNVSANKLFRNDGGSWVDATSGPLCDTNAGEGVAWGDYDNDGDLDLYLVNRGEANKLFRNDAGSWVDATSGPLGDTSLGIGVAWGDYDNDGDLDIYLSNGIGEANKLFRNDGQGWVDATSDPLGDTGRGTSVAWGDYDGDGDLDLYLVNNFNANKLFRNENANGNHWLHVKLEGVVSNRSGIGARVRVVVGGVSRIDEISGGSGFGSQNSLTAEFGLGTATTVDSLIILWPSGILQVVDVGATVDEVVTIVEDDTVPTQQPVEPGSVLPAVFALGAAYPNPFNPLTTLSFAVPRQIHVRLSVYDVTGRHVRTLVNEELATGRYNVVWEGVDAVGRAVASGVYLYRMQAGPFVDCRRVVLSR